MSTNLMHASFQPRIWRMQQALALVRARLSMSDYWFLFGLWLALLYLADPFSVRLDKIGLTKHLPLVFSLGGALLVNIGALLFPADPSVSYTRRTNRHWQVLAAGWPLALLGLWILVGSFYARKYGDINNTFIIVGLYMLFSLFTARVILLSQARGAIVRSYLFAAACAAAFMVARMAIPIENTAVSYHELEALVVPLAVYFSLRPMGNRSWNFLLALFFLLGGVVFQKNTSFLVLGLTLIYLWLVEWRFRFKESFSFRFWALFWLLLLVVVGIAAVGYLAYQRGTLMPSGNPQYRLKTYEVAWNRFLSSPLWGTGFTGSATEKFTGYQILVARGNLATHSDILDLAAQGGILAVLLWLWGYLRIGALALRNVLRERPRDDLAAAAHALACMSLTSIVVYAFNPILLQPAKALLLWGQLGMLLGIALHRASTAPPPAASVKPGIHPRFPIVPVEKPR